MTKRPFLYVDIPLARLRPRQPQQRRATLFALCTLLAACPALATGCGDDDGGSPTVDAAPGSDASTGTDAAPGTDAGAGTDGGVTAPRVRLVLHGGGSEDDFLYKRFVEEAGNGHIVTLGARAADDADLTFWDGYFMSLGASSAETINTTTADEATSASLREILDRADGIFIRGGNQANYVEFWRDGPIHPGLMAAWERGAVLSGSSAGAMVLGGPIYDARVSGIGAYDALLDARDDAITLANSLIPALDNIGVVVDTHFTARGRVGRLPVFAAHAKEAHEAADADGEPPLAMGIDSRTAVLWRDDDTFEIIGHGSVTIIDPRMGTYSLDQGKPPQITGMGLWQLTAGYEFDLAALQRGDSPVLTRPAYVEKRSSTPATVGPLPSRSISGSDVQLRGLGSYQLGGLNDDDFGWRNGTLTLDEGFDALTGTLVVTRLYDNSDFFENYFGGMMWALAQRPEIIAIGADVGLSADITAVGQIVGGPGGYAMIIDAREATHMGVPPASDAPNSENWQTAAIEGALIRIINEDASWDVSAGPWTPGGVTVTAPVTAPPR